MKVLMVCLGNICRSPLAEGILKHQAEQAGIDMIVDSAGTAAYHVGEAPDPRSIEVAAKNGISINQQQARQFVQEDFELFDHIFVMDKSNYENVIKQARTAADKLKVSLILESHPSSDLVEVPDPYYGDNDGFVKVYNMLEIACQEFIRNEDR